MENKSKLQKLLKVVKRPELIGIRIIENISYFIPDKLYLRIMYKLYTRHCLDLKNPIDYTEKLQWLKLYNRCPEYTMMVDKIRVKEYVAKIIGQEHIIPTLGVWEKPEDIDFDKLPDKFVLKCNHNSGSGMCICKDKNKLNLSEVKKKLKKGLAQNYYLHAREWPYRNVHRQILAEKFMENGGEADLVDYKFFCFDGEPYIMYVSCDNSDHSTTDFFDMNYNLLPIRMKDPNSNNPSPKKVEEFDEMRNYARKLSKGIPHVRVDFYVINHHVYFGELTFFHNAGFSLVHPDEWNRKLGDMIDLKKID